jgi:hypothetical protein
MQHTPALCRTLMLPSQLMPTSTMMLCSQPLWPQLLLLLLLLRRHTLSSHQPMLTSRQQQQQQ